MAKLYFYYSAMNAGKTTTLLQSSFNYQERGMHTMLFTAEIDDRFGKSKITSRIGLSETANVFNPQTNMWQSIQNAHQQQKINCILVDEAQFLTKEHVLDLARVCDELSIPVLCYGLRTDFQGNMFPGSRHLLALADELCELKTICTCGSKATMNLRIDANGNAISHGEQTDIGGEDKYIALCRKHFMQAHAKAKQQKAG